MARWTSKELILNIKTSQEAIIFLEAIQKQIKIVDIFADYIPGKVTIRFEGAKENLKEAIEIAKKIHQMVNGMLYPDSKDLYEYNIGFISKMSGKTFPLKVIERILTLKGFELSRENEILYTKIDYKNIMKVITAIDQMLSEMPYEVSTSSLRDVIVTIAIIKNITIQDTITLLKKTEAIKEDDLQRLILSMEPEQAINLSLK
ncbi:MAG: DUF2067 family protein [Candidatus Thorarchaeota archaeon]